MRSLITLGLLIAAIATGAAGCSDDAGAADAAPDAGIDPEADAGPRVGRVCDIGIEDAGAETPTVLATPALDCTSRICLHIEGTLPNMCTRTCADASQCIAAPETACTSGFACEPVIDVGPFAGESMCVCRDHLADGGV
jgi:hypothetical protein